MNINWGDKQPISKMILETIVQSSLGQRGIFFYNQLTELGVKVPLPMIMHCDNEAAVTLANRKEINVLGRTKYFNRLIWKIQEAVSSNMVKPTWCASEDMDSDMGTKALMGSNFDRVSNRSFSRMNPTIEVKVSEFLDPWRKEDISVKGQNKEIATKTRLGPERGGSACDKNNQGSISKSDSNEVSKPSISESNPGSNKPVKQLINNSKSTKTGGM